MALIKIKMALLLLLFVIQLSHTIVQSEKALAGTEVIFFDLCSNWLFTNDTVTNISATSMNGASIKYGELRINNINGYHEGLYKCSSDHSVAAKNLTVYAVPQFQSFGTHEVSDGQSTVLNISLDYVNGGARGAKQNIYAVILKKGGSSLLFCYTDGRSCSVKKSFIQDYTPIDAPSNFTASIRTSNVNISSDNGTYEVAVELNVIDSSVSIAATSKSTFNLLVTAPSSTITTSSIEPSVMTSIFSSTIMTTETLPVPSSSTTLLTTTQTSSVSLETATETSNILISSMITTSNTPSTTPSSNYTSNFLDEKSIIMIAVLITILAIIVIVVILLLCLVQRRRKSSHYSRNVIKMFNPTTQNRSEDVERPSRDRDDKRSYCSEAGESATSLSPNFLYDTIPAFVLTLGPGNSKIARV